MVVQFRFSYGTKLRPDQVIALNGILDEKVAVDGEGKLDDDSMWKPYMGPLESVLTILGNDSKIELEGLGKPSAVMQLMDKLEHLQRKLDAKMEGIEELRNYNERCRVHVPSNALLEFTEVTVMYDCCTDALQKDLEDGWRIICACPQPDQRRPDYVLGRVAT